MIEEILKNERVKSWLKDAIKINDKRYPVSLVEEIIEGDINDFMFALENENL